MLYNPEWNDEKLVQEFYEFVKQKDPNETYCYFDSYGCAVGQFMDHIGISIDEWKRNWLKWRTPIERYASSVKTFGEVVENMRCEM